MLVQFIVDNHKEVWIDPDTLHLKALIQGQYDMSGIQEAHEPHVAAALNTTWHAIVRNLALHTQEVKLERGPEIAVIATQYGVQIGIRHVRRSD